ncbi:DUF1885 family protein [Metabacillus sp. RGM 3146]|uniref:DUF1885 family protein n=1 Tax=Metabacillus sp. RGM 3146 TaxID=3401092 RepID=UPI003B9AB53D
MDTRATIKLLSSSEKSRITLKETIDYLTYYKEITSKTGDQLDWNYGAAAFPYSIESHEGYAELKSSERGYNRFIIAVGEDQETQCSFIQIILPQSSTYADKSKANELCKFLARKLKAELHLFSGKIIHQYA